MSNRLSRHHLLNSRQEWSLRPDAHELRSTQSLIPRIPRDIHDALHEACPPVPLLGIYTLRNTVQLFEPTGRTMPDIDRLQSAIERATRSPRFHPLERDLAGLAIEAIDLQKPFIREAITR